MWDAEERAEFLQHVANVRMFAVTFLKEFFGERCSNFFDPVCECCRRWKALDDLTRDPWDGEK